LAADFARRGWITGVGWTEGRELWSCETIEVMHLSVADSASQWRICEAAAQLDRDVTFYCDLDIPATQHYLYLKRLFPLCRVEADVEARGNVMEIAATNSAWELDHPLPPLRTLRMRGERMRPLNEKSRIIIAAGDDETVLCPAEGAAAIHAFNALIQRHNPDLILTEHGDSILFPTLLKIAKRERLPLTLDRIFTERKIETEGRTHYSYGNIVYKPPSYPLFGRCHIDRENL
jgi:DNA polymerase-2